MYACRYIYKYIYIRGTPLWTTESVLWKIDKYEQGKVLKKIVSGVVFSQNNLVLLVAILILGSKYKQDIYVYINALVYYNKVSLSTLSSVEGLGTSRNQSHRVLLRRIIGR